MRALSLSLTFILALIFATATTAQTIADKELAGGDAANDIVDGIDISDAINPSFSINLFVTRPGGETRPGGSAGGALTRDQETSAVIVGGFFEKDRGGQPRCNYYLSSVPPGETLPPKRIAPEQSVPAPAFAWELHARLLDVEDEVVRMAYRWSRTPLYGDAATVPILGQEETVELSHGKYRVIDRMAIKAPEGLECRYESLMMTLSTEVAGRPEVAQKPVSHKVWMLRDTPGDAGKIEQQTIQGRQGDALNFDFETWRSEAPELKTSEGQNAYASMRVAGSVRTWRIDEELFLVVVQARSILAKRFSAFPQGSSSFGVGRKRFVVRAGETVGIVIPSPSRPIRLQAGNVQPSSLQPNGWDGPIPAGYERDGDDILIPIHKEMAADEISIVIQTEP